MRILLVEDHLLIQQSLAHLLDAQPNMSVVGGARSVHEAVTQARQHNPDCILMDFSLPDGTGLEATRAILAQQPYIKIVLLTLYDDEETLFDAIGHGAQGYLSKHITAAQLVDYLCATMRGEYAIEPHYTKRIIAEFAKLPKPKRTLPRLSEQFLLPRIDVQTLPEWGISTTTRRGGDRTLPRNLQKRPNGSQYG
jgi:DNA-binding NarL/FixJ family response regulator